MWIYDEEAALLLSDDYRRLCAWAIVDGIVETYKLQRKPPTPPVASDAVTVMIDGIQIDDGILRNGRAYVPARAVGEALNMTMSWKAASKTASLETKK